MSHEIRIEKSYDHSPEDVWRALTDSQSLADWLMPNDFEPRLGHKFQFRTKPQPGWRGIVDCEVIEIEEPKQLAYTWQGDVNGPIMVVRWTLQPVEAGTRLVLEHTGFRGVGGFFLKWILRQGWKKMLRIKFPRALDCFVSKTG